MLVSIKELNEAKLKEGIVLGAQIKQLLETHDFSIEFNARERKAWVKAENVKKKHSRR